MLYAPLSHINALPWRIKRSCYVAGHCCVVFDYKSTGQEKATPRTIINMQRERSYILSLIKVNTALQPKNYYCGFRGEVVGKCRQDGRRMPPGIYTVISYLSLPLKESILFFIFNVHATENTVSLEEHT